MTDTDGVAVRVVETPADRLRRLALAPGDVSRQDFREAIAAAVNDISGRLAVLEAEAADRATWTASGGPVQPG